MIRVLLGLMLIAEMCLGGNSIETTKPLDSTAPVTGVWSECNPGPMGTSETTGPMSSDYRYIERIDTVWTKKVPVCLTPNELRTLKEMLEWWNAAKELNGIPESHIIWDREGDSAILHIWPSDIVPYLESDSITAIDTALVW